MKKRINTTVEQEAVALYGITSNRFEAGYILRDGSMLDFSGKKTGADGGYRTMDHREVSELYPENDFDCRSNAIDQFVKDTGAIRVSFDKGGDFALIDIVKQVRLSGAQATALAQCTRRLKSVTLDVYDALFAQSPCESFDMDFPRISDVINVLSKY